MSGMIRPAAIKGWFSLIHSQAQASNLKTATVTFIWFWKNSILTSFGRSFVALPRPKQRRWDNGPNNSWYRGDVGWLTLKYAGKKWKGKVGSDKPFMSSGVYHEAQAISGDEK